MLLAGSKLEVVFRKVKHVREHMLANCLAGDRAKISVEDLQWCIQEMYDLKIEKNEVAFDGEHVFGMVERYADRAKIWLRKNQPEDYLRFVCVKELCQIVIDEEEDWSPLGTTTIESLVYEVILDMERNDGQVRELPSPVTQSEFWAEIAATELVYPFEHREVDAAAIKGRTTTYNSLALHFHVPEFVIGTAHHPGHKAIAKKGWALVSD